MITIIPSVGRSSCNSCNCSTKSEEKTFFEIRFQISDNGATVMTVCDDCLVSLKLAIYKLEKEVAQRCQAKI